MEQDSMRNLVLTGISSSNGGTFRSVKMDGVSKVNGDLVCTDFRSNGKTDVYGSVTAPTAEIKGRSFVEGNLHTGRVILQGKAIIHGNLTADSIEITGMAALKGKCETEKLQASGRLHMGELNAGTLHLTLSGSSVIDEIGGESIHVRKQPGVDFAHWLKVLPIPLGNKLTAKTIEGDEVYVEATTADVVRGTRVVIGPGCHIGLVEYKEKFEQGKGSTVKRLERV